MTTLLDGIIEHLSLFLHYLLLGRDLGLCGRPGLARVLAQTVAQAIFQVDSIFVIAVITLVVDFILLMYRD